MRKGFSQILLIFLLSLPVTMLANGFSYVYIQGDKSIPFYVKLEDVMLPRYGKNYNLIPQLAPGPISIQILFQQNAYPAQKFTIVVPENGFRGFLLLKRDGAYKLYDIHQQFYLQPGNKAEDDRPPADNATAAYVYTETAPAGSNDVTTTTVRGSKVPNFLPDVVLDNERTVQVKRDQPKYIEETNDDDRQYVNTNYEVEEPGGNTVVVANSDCPAAISGEEFESLLSKASGKADKVRLKYLLSQMEECYNANQARILVETLNNDPEKYTLLKRIYSRVTDQHNFPMLENLLSTQEWKSYFRLILPK